MRGATIRIILTAFLLQLLLMLPAGRDSGRHHSSARTERIECDRRKDHVRVALRSSASHGYYVFEELMTERSGTIDLLAVGPVGAIVVVVRDEPGTVTADVDATLYLNARPFPEDPREQAAELAADVNARFEGLGAHAYHVVCFTRAELKYLGDNENVLWGVCPTWDLPLAFEEADVNHTPADVEDLAEFVRDVYGRPSFVVPEGGET